MDINDIVAKLEDLAHNFYWGWHPEVINVFRDLDPQLWRTVNHNPIEFIARLAKKVLAEKAAQPVSETHLSQAVQQLHRYLETPDTWGHWHAGPLRVNPVAYFCAEFGLHESLPIYSGGLGVLAGDHLKAASDLAVPIIGVGLCYMKGYFEQSLDANGWQQEHYVNYDISTLPLTPTTDEYGRPIRIIVRAGSSDICVRAWAADIGRNRLLLLDTNVEGNSEKDRALTSTLYSGDDELRIRQQIVLGVGGLRMLAAMNIHPSVIHLNEGHAAFAILALALSLMKRDGQPFENVQKLAAGMTVFTIHTPIEAAIDRYEPELIKQELEPLRDQLKITEKELLALGQIDPENDQEAFCPTVLALKMSQWRNGVSALHARVSRSMWHNIWPELREDRIPIGFITNGVHVSTWLAEAMNQLYDRYLGKDWLERIDNPNTWTAVTQIDDAELWEKGQFLRNHLIEYVRRTAYAQAKAKGESEEICKATLTYLSPSVLTIGFARRFAAYKRCNLIFEDLNWLEHIVNHPERPVQIVIAGKAHPKDTPAKQILQKVFQVARESRFLGKVVLLENYSINVSRHLVQGADLWLSLPRRPLEACGTSGQKAMINGALNMSVLDGWWAEAYNGRNGFAIGSGGEHADWERQDSLDAQSFRNVLEEKVIPLFYDRDGQGIPRGWLAMQKHALRTLAWKFNARRMLRDYTLGCYLPAVGGLASSLAPDKQAH
ncbi:MAG: glycosyltransferase family 1 protein [Planctomycetes bacterium]|nr:glycosyltransferase family 1 protein [Planctomycetota bacterium]